MSIVTAYDSLGSAGLEHSLLQSDAEAIYTDPHLLKTASEPLKKAKGIKFVIYNDSSHFSDGTEVEAFKKSNPDMPVYSVEEVRKMGEQNPVDPVEPTPDTLFCIMYTSGSTGLPKGVPMTHENMVASGMNLLTRKSDRYPTVEERDANTSLQSPASTSTSRTLSVIRTLAWHIFP